MGLCLTVSLARGENAKPLHGITLYREVSEATINKTRYAEVTVKIKAADIAPLSAKGVKVVVTDDATGKKVYRKRFLRSRLWAFSDGDIEIGDGNALTHAIICKEGGRWTMRLKEKGIY